MLLVQIFWNSSRGGFYFIPLEVQNDIFNKLGNDNFLTMPKAGTNPRGVEYSKEALSMMVSHPLTRRIEIYWEKEEIKHDVYKRWIDYWE